MPDEQMTALTGITKLHAAHRQLNAAIRLYFSNFDPVAVCTLVGAASVIFSDLTQKRAPEEWWDRMAWEANGINPKEYFTVLRKPQNFLKHADDDPDATLDLNEREIEDIILFATLNAGAVGGGISTSEQVFQLWYFATRPEMMPKDFAPLPTARDHFPGILGLSPADRKSFGLQRLLEAQNEANADVRDDQR